MRKVLSYNYNPKATSAPPRAGTTGLIIYLVIISTFGLFDFKNICHLRIGNTLDSEFYIVLPSDWLVAGDYSNRRKQCDFNGKTIYSKPPIDGTISQHEILDPDSSINAFTTGLVTPEDPLQWWR